MLKVLNMLRAFAWAAMRRECRSVRTNGALRTAKREVERPWRAAYHALG